MNYISLPTTSANIYPSFRCPHVHVGYINRVAANTSSDTTASYIRKYTIRICQDCGRELACHD